MCQQFFSNSFRFPWSVTFVKIQLLKIVSRNNKILATEMETQHWKKVSIISNSNYLYSIKMKFLISDRSLVRIISKQFLPVSLRFSVVFWQSPCCCCCGVVVANLICPKWRIILLCCLLDWKGRWRRWERAWGRRWWSRARRNRSCKRWSWLQGKSNPSRAPIRRWSG